MILDLHRSSLDEAAVLFCPSGFPAHTKKSGRLYRGNSLAGASRSAENTKNRKNFSKSLH